jgi:hypothetical protein
MLYQMGVEAIGKPVESKNVEEYPLQLADDTDSKQFVWLTEDIFVSVRSIQHSSFSLLSPFSSSCF